MPLIVFVAVVEPIQAAVILTPGAFISTQLPWFEKDAGVSFSDVAPTVMALGAPAGERVQASVASLPAAATTVMPALVNL